MTISISARIKNKSNPFFLENLPSNLHTFSSFYRQKIFLFSSDHKTFPGTTRPSMCVCVNVYCTKIFTINHSNVHKYIYLFSSSSRHHPFCFAFFLIFFYFFPRITLHSALSLARKCVCIFV